MMAAALLIAINHRRAPASMPAPKPAPSSAVRLLVERDAGVLRLRWNPDAPDIRAASRGVLTINDDGRESQLSLEEPELLGGMATYRPQGQEVRFRLELAGGASGEIRVAAERRPSPFEPAPKPARLAEAAPPLQKRSPDADRDEEEPHSTYTRYWTPAPARAPVAVAAPVRVPAPVAAPPPPPAPRPVVEDRAAVPSRAQLARREVVEAPEEKEEPAPKHSRLGRVVRKIPLLRRLHKERQE
jgi:hypothetical protein